MELFGYWWTMANRPGKMLADGDFMSRLGEDLWIDPLLKDYLSIAQQLYTTSPPATGDISPDNMPSRRTKKSKIEPDEEPVCASVLRVINEFPSCEIIAQQNPTPKYHNIPVVFISELNFKPRSQRHFSYVVETALALKTRAWCLYRPQHGHFLQAARQGSITFEAIVAIEPIQTCHNTLQDYWEVPIIKETVLSAIQFFSNKFTPKLQGYYANMEKIATPEKYSAKLVLQFTLIDLLRTISGLKLFMFEMPDTNIPESAKSTFLTRLRKNNWNVSEQTILSSDHSDRVSHSVRLFFGHHKNDSATTTQQRFQVLDTP
eukprot:scaffold5015_cov51-Attheya_sp.AAC.2